MNNYVARDDTGEVAIIERDTRRANRWVVYWMSGRAPEHGFTQLKEAQSFVERLRHSHAITWELRK